MRRIIQALDKLSLHDREYLYNRMQSSRRWKSEFRNEWMKSYECDPESLSIRNTIGPNDLDLLKIGIVLPPMKLFIPEGIDPDAKD